MLQIGILGAETHTAQFAQIVNVERRLRGVRISHVCGRTARAAREAAGAGMIPHMVAKPVDLIGAVDAVVVDHIHGKYHLPAARPLLRRSNEVRFF